MERKTPLRKKLEEAKEINEVRDYVIDDILEYDSDEEMEARIKDLVTHGCSGGSVCGLIYYVDTHKFFDKYYEDIQEIINEYKDSTGIFPEYKGDMKNWYAWFAFEQEAFNLANELDIEV